MVKSRFLLALEFWYNALGQLLAELDTPLVERVDVPNGTLCKDAMLVESDEFTKGFWSKPLAQNCVRWAVTFEAPVWHEPVRRALRLDLLGCLAESQRLGLGEHIREENIVVTAQRI